MLKVQWQSRLIGQLIMMYCLHLVERTHKDAGEHKLGLYREKSDLDHEKNKRGLTVRALVRSLCQIALFRLQRKLIYQVVDRLDLCELRIFEDVPIDGSVGEPSALDRRLEAVAIAFHRECPVTPDRSTSLDTVGYMKQGVDGDWTCGHASCIVLIVKPVGSKVKLATIQICEAYLSYFSTQSTNPFRRKSTSSCVILNLRQVVNSLTRRVKCL